MMLTMVLFVNNIKRYVFGTEKRTMLHDLSRLQECYVSAKVTCKTHVSHHDVSLSNARQSV